MLIIVVGFKYYIGFRKELDVMDDIWAAAYLPFTDYAITYNDFCTLLQSAGLASQYGVQVYSMSTTNDIIKGLKKVIL